MTTWTPATVQPETYTLIAQTIVRTFSPFTFSRRPVFDTGPSSGIWDTKVEQTEIWTVQP